MEESRPTFQAAYLREAQTMGRDYYQKVKIGGKNYFVMVLRGGDLSRMQAHDAAKLKNLSETFFSAHQGPLETDLNDSDITHIDSEGIHFRERETKISRETGIDDEVKDLLMAEFDSEKKAIVEHYKQATAPVAKAAIPAQYRPYLNENEADKDKNGLYNDVAIKGAIKRYTLSRFDRIMDVVVSSNPECKVGKQLAEIAEANPNDADYKNFLDKSCAMLKQYMTAQTVWKAMMNVLLPEQLIFVRDPEEEEVVRDLEEKEVLPLDSGDPSGHLDSLGSVHLREREVHSGEHRGREHEELDAFASVTPRPTKEGWGAMFSRWGSTAYSYVPPRTSIPLVGRLFSESTPVSRVEEEVELRPMGSSRVVELGEEISFLPLTAQEVHNELTLAAQGAPEGNIPVASKQAVARTALDKIRAKMRKKEDIEAFTENEQRVIKEAINRHAKFMKGKSHNSQLTAILNGLRTIDEGH
ncbi:hypothetical protein [Candidatus Neptunichlamydia sp. REUL1]|uniref:hypothetical protein n=1 Tax=Candidatus Neptunichlamydia sp. REUL1 TaxID=3064277 RepID=UPI00292D3DB5|nr:hypothetical protein [Candidatus Neptunochlamydia sp. REUL1]